MLEKMKNEKKKEIRKMKKEMIRERYARKKLDQSLDQTNKNRNHIVINARAKHRLGTNSYDSLKIQMYAQKIVSNLWSYHLIIHREFVL